MTDTNRQKLCAGAITFIKQAIVPLDDPVITLGASIVRDATAQLHSKSTAFSLLQTFIEHGLKQIKTGTHPFAFKESLAKGVSLTLSRLLKRPATSEDLISIDPLIATALQREIVFIESGHSPKTTLTYSSGLELNCGYLSSYFCTDTENLTCEMHNTAISTTNKTISSPQEIILLLQNTKNQSHLIIAPAITGDALSTLIVNQLRGTAKVCAIKKGKTGIPYKLASKVVACKERTIVFIPELKASNIAILRVGGLTQAEIQQKRKLFESNLFAAQSAIKEGMAYLPKLKSHFVLRACSAAFAKPMPYRLIEEALKTAAKAAEILLLSDALIKS